MTDTRIAEIRARAVAFYEWVNAPSPLWAVEPADVRVYRYEVFNKSVTIVTSDIPYLLDQIDAKDAELAFVREQLNILDAQIDAKDAEIERLRSEIDAWQASFPGYCSGGES